MGKGGVAKTKEIEYKRIEKELANIRGKFSQSNKLTQDQRKKYVLKLVYIFILGYDARCVHGNVSWHMAHLGGGLPSVFIFCSTDGDSVIVEFPPQRFASGFRLIILDSLVLITDDVILL